MRRAHLQRSAMVDSSGVPSTDAGDTSPGISLLETQLYVTKSRPNLDGASHHSSQLDSDASETGTSAPSYG